MWESWNPQRSDAVEESSSGSTVREKTLIEKTADNFEVIIQSFLPHTRPDIRISQSQMRHGVFLPIADSGLELRSVIA
jgi:hypothetical protein